MWDAFQREMLATLGHEPMMLVPPELPDDPLLHAVLRAASRDRDAGDLTMLLRALPAMPTLRGNAAAKRAAWPLLRQWRSTL